MNEPVTRPVNGHIHRAGTLRVKALKGRVRRFQYVDLEANYPALGYESRGRWIYRITRNETEEPARGVTLGAILEQVRRRVLIEVERWPDAVANQEGK